MSEEYKKKIGIPEAHSLQQVSMEWKGQRKGQDIDVYVFDELDPDGNVVASYEVTDSTSIYPPFDRHISHQKFRK
ncbi:hypothetical protein ABKU55_02325 [Enterobacter hormaechei]|uniref:hypothetical protein n=1 Tax=Enterobacter cloacae complex TaxID=354276 RepID=UPI000735B965|nr:hypothetical protein [Enterobacter hormaechei]AWX03750.1 hypothetical protein DPF84_19215 [Enterobacter hormaechei]AWX04409.1 hypothetical protein DPF84_22810 [Enterobacter hormaechei]ELJ9645895.1 hypothetical protein [Enterobacter hormaechei]KTI16342.1 hypothetical protein ASV10_24350 [Enterobacter hormaechei subsp. xiangfangensis]KTJ09896.1 hypothetical protein ASU90_23850 [Enterobacter hormaechei subsp. xiangfangensis]